MSEPPSVIADDRLYTWRFFRVFGGVMLFMTGAALQFHFGQYVQYLGHGVDTLGVVLGVSMVGTLAIRLHIGRWIDRFGCRPTWVVGALSATLAAAAIQFTEQLWLIVVLRHAVFLSLMTWTGEYSKMRSLRNFKKKILSSTYRVMKAARVSEI